MANVFETITGLFKESLQNPDQEPRLPVVLRDLEERIDSLMDVASGPNGNDVATWVASFKELITDSAVRDALIVRTLQLRFPRLAETLTFLGIIDFGSFDAASQRWSTLKINWQQLEKVLKDPGGYAANDGLSYLFTRIKTIEDLRAMQVFLGLLLAAPLELVKLDYKEEGFTGLPREGESGIDLPGLLDLINSPLTLHLPFSPPLTLASFKANATGPDGAVGSIALVGPDGDSSTHITTLDKLGIELRLQNASTAAQQTVELGGDWQLKFRAPVGSGNTKLTLQLNGDVLQAPARADFDVLLQKQHSSGSSAVLIGETDGTHFSVDRVELGLRLRSVGPLFDLLLKLQQMEFALEPGFLKMFKFAGALPATIKFNSDVELAYTHGQGMSANDSGDGSLSARFADPIGLKIGTDSAGVTVEQVRVALQARLAGEDINFRTVMQFDASARFGPLGATMNGTGAWVGRWGAQTGDAMAPDGIGLSLDAPPIIGGGSIQRLSDRQFGGGLQLKILGIGAFAYALYETLADGAPSLAALIGIRLPPPGVQLGFGFAVSGFGGLVGINRRANTDVLRERLASGSAGDVLFNDDPMRNAPRLLGDMAQFFPAQRGTFLLGPTLQINWLSLFKLDAGVFIELPGPSKIFICGSARLVVGSEQFALVYLRMDFIGGIDLTKSLIFFDGMLVNSHVLSIFRITGGVALRIVYGDQGYFLFSVGGFHPSFHPNGMPVPSVPRVGVSTSFGPAWLKMDYYLAITSNTFQTGARTEAGIEVGPLNAHGWFGFDALIQFKPFQFEAVIDAGFDVEVEDVSLCNVRIEGMLSGPGPLVLRARGRVKVLFVPISGNVTIRLSDNPPALPAPIPKLVEYLSGELSNPENLRGEGDDPHFIFAPLTTVPAGTGKLIAPVGSLVWEQKRAPLNLAIEKLEGVDLGGRHTLHVSAASAFAQSDEMDWFSVGTYLKLNDGEALNNARFAQQVSGLRVGAGALDEGQAKDVTPELELYKIAAPLPVSLSPTKMAHPNYLSDGLAALLRERAGGAVPESGPARVKVLQEQWGVHSVSGDAASTGALNTVQAFAEARRRAGVAVPATDQPLSLAGVN